MLCICLPQVAEMAAGIEVPAVAIEVPPLPAGAAELAIAAGVAGSVNATADMAASGALEAMLSAELPAFSLEAVLGLEAMAQVGGSLGIEMTGPSAAMDLSLAAGALNIAAPALEGLGASLGAAMAPLGGLPMALSINAAIEASLGINMGAPGAAAALEASLAAALEASMAMSASLGLSVAGAAELGLAARALNAAVALGFNPAAPGEFAAAMELAGGLEVPPLALSAGEMGEISAGLTDFGLVSGATGGMEMGLALPALEAGAAAMAASMEAAVDANASVAAELSAGAGGSAELAAAMAAAIEAPMGAAGDLGAIGLGGLPGMGDMSIAASLAASFEAAMGAPMLSGMPCPNIFCVAGR